MASIGDENAGCAPAFPQEWSSAMRRGFKHILPLPDHLTQEARHLREEAEQMPHGAEQQMLLRKARQAETGAHLGERLSSPGLQPPA